jgi:hypothetical protein
MFGVVMLAVPAMHHHCRDAGKRLISPLIKMNKMQAIKTHDTLQAIVTPSTQRNLRGPHSPTWGPPLLLLQLQLLPAGLDCRAASLIAACLPVDFCICSFIYH